MKYLLCCLLLVTACLAFRFVPEDDHKWISLFNGKDLRGWDTYLGPERDSNGKKISDQPVGLNRDPKGVFSIVKDGKENVIRISGEQIGGIISRKEYENYHLQLLFRWGTLTWGSKKGKKKDSGLLYHSVGPNGADGGAWMRSQEFQVEETNCGDYWGCAGAIADIPAVKISDSNYRYTPDGSLYTFRTGNGIGRHCIKGPDAEHPTGEWNTLDLYCHGDTSVHVVNGKVMMVLYHSAQVDNGQVSSLAKGRIQLQSEGAEVFYKDIRIQTLNKIPMDLLATNGGTALAGDKYDLYLLVGQSNMAGRAPLDSLSKQIDPRLWMLDKAGQWVPATDPVHFDKPDVVAVGPALSFAKEMLKETRGKIGLIPCAVGGSPIRVWEPDSTYLNGLHPYDDAIRRARIGLQQGRLKGILWHQGESDNNPAGMAVYMDKLKILIDRLRKDLGQPDLPFVAGEIGTFKEAPINAIIDELPHKVLHTAVVSAAGLTDKGDKTHFDTRSARELGRRYARAMTGLQHQL